MIFVSGSAAPIVPSGVQSEGVNTAGGKASVDFEITTNFNRAELDKLAKQAVKGKVAETQALLDRLHRTYSGRPVAEVEAALIREWRRAGGTISDPEATEWATLISEDTRIVLRP
jgi:hypothetical protein